MNDQQPLYQQFFEEYAQLLRMRLKHYHHDNGGPTQFLNALIITPSLDDSCHEVVSFASQQVGQLNEWLANTTPYDAELVQVSVDAGGELCYEFHVYISIKDKTVEEIELLCVALMNNTYEAYLDNYDDVKLTEISDQVWDEMLQEVKAAISFGTLCLTEAN